MHSGECGHSSAQGEEADSLNSNPSLRAEGGGGAELKLTPFSAKPGHVAQA